MRRGPSGGGSAGLARSCPKQAPMLAIVISAKPRVETVMILVLALSGAI
jgi:hypothetical protein